MPFDIEYFEQHKVLVAGVALAGVAGIYLLSRQKSNSAASSGTSATYGYGGLSATNASLIASSQQTSAQETLGVDQLQAQQNIATTQAQYQLAALTTKYNALTTENNTNAQLQASAISANANTQNLSIAAQLQAALAGDAVSTAGIQAQLQGLEANDQTSVDLGNINAQEQTSIASLTAGVQGQIANDQLQLGLAQTAGAVNIADTASNNAVKTTAITAGSGIVSGLIGALL
jgi:hypothetical protein